MAFTLSIVGFFLALILIIMIHELGHYLFARVFRFRVLEYFVGFGPRLWSFRKGEIEYGVKAIPAGGYVKIAGMNPLEDDVPPGDEDRAYYAKPVGQRALVILAGPLSHFLVAMLIFSGLSFFVGDTAHTTTSVVGGVTEELAKGVPSPASVAGLREGDVIARIGTLENPSPDQLGQYQQAHVGEAIDYVILRDDTTITVTMRPIKSVLDGSNRARIGIELSPVPLPFFSAFAAGSQETWDMTRESFSQLGHVFGPEGVARTFRLLFTDEPRKITDPGSVVAIGDTAGGLGQRGEWATLVWLFAYVVLFIGLVNLLPLPPFDGGHLAVLVIEKVRGRRVDMRKLIPVSAVVLSFFVLFTAATLALDIFKPIPSGP